MTRSPFDLTGKVVLVTGGNGGIGLGMAEGLAAAGATTVVWGRDPAKNEAAAATLAALSPNTSVHAVDVADEAAVNAEMMVILATHGRIDAVFANAGRGQAPTPFLNQSRAQWDEVFSTNLWGVRATLQAGARHMVDRAKAGEPGGSLVAVASLAGINATPYLEAYGVSKAATLSLSRHLAGSFGRYGIRSNAIIPGWIETDMTAGSKANPDIEKAVSARIPLRRWGRPDDFAAIAVYLASDGSRYHTADTFVIDGAYAVTMV
jgi:NAD(P)-dependent dehydrogenase (short-subunit alcohol dehydrogenase family)